MTSPLADTAPAPFAVPGPAEKQSGTETTAAAEEPTESQGFYDIAKPTCSLNLVCYRSGAKGCDLVQVQCVRRSMFSSDASFATVVETHPRLVHADDQFFREICRLYTTEMCGFFRRYFSLKTLRAFRVLTFTPTTRPTVVPFDDFVLQEMMYAYRHPDRLSSTHDWVDWVFWLRQKDRRHALEFVEG
ncbi:hypothetical protein N658DRAFT_505733 [Parathielavia hyrcaniae]|uniref:Uncharacterized protein n=1 Tax=Parathielavia hyrcaniae TaxID=113614 RepID=A0AAN6Q4E0_9PEZI|nr:hypothetical protein N658DRAFT_505733 [Parathielavia hyrcaniae]